IEGAWLILRVKRPECPAILIDESNLDAGTRRQWPSAVEVVRGDLSDVPAERLVDLEEGPVCRTADHEVRVIQIVKDTLSSRGSGSQRDNGSKRRRENQVGPAFHVHPPNCWGLSISTPRAAFPSSSGFNLENANRAKMGSSKPPATPQ